MKNQNLIYKWFLNYFIRLEVHTKSGSEEVTGLTKKAYDKASPMLAGMGSTLATAANLGDHVELKLANIGTNTALNNFALV